MEKVIDHFTFKDGKLQPQIFSLVLVTIILVVLTMVIYNKVKEAKPNKAPEGIVLLAEQYVMGIEGQYQGATDGKFKKPGPYIFTLITFLMVGNLFGLIGLEPPTTSYSVTLTIGLVSWMGIYVVGITFKKWSFFKKFLNPTELIGQFSPLISLSFRLFGNMIAGSTIMYLLYHFFGWVWGFIPILGGFNLIGPILAWPLHVYFDLFDGIVQAFVFTLLTMIYWALEVPTENGEQKVKKEKKKAIKA